jgi:ubiquinone/menaquinone biosynthesis C-methylase UbiE
MRYLTAEEIRKLKTGDGRELVENCAGKSVRDLFAIKVFNNYFDKFFKNKAIAKILDLGPASGAFAAQIAQEGYKTIYGIDIDNYLRPQNRALFKEFKIADLSWEKLPWVDKFFQIVTAWCVFPHLENPFHAIREASRVLDKKGLLIFTTPHLTSKPSVDYFVKNKDFGSYRVQNNHLVIFSKGVFKKAVEKYFNLIDVEYHVRPKIFKNGLAGRLRHLLYRLANRVSPKFKKSLEKRWSYNIVYILQKKDI